ncbi:MFS transporter [Candidatus Microgenomates bacterium]|nr:MFS transporter [Candidatus Microgenomates bacterium]
MIKDKNQSGRVVTFSSIFHFLLPGKIKTHLEDFFSNRAIRILVATNGLVLVAGAMLAPIYAVYVDIIGGDLMDASFAGGVFALAAGTTVLLAGKFSDRVKEQELVVVTGYVVMGIGFLLYIFVDSVIFLFLVQVLIGFGEAFYSPAFDAVYSKHIENSKAGSQWGAWESMNYFTAAIGAVLGGLVVKNFGFTPVFIIMASLCFASALYIYLLPRRLL